MDILILTPDTDIDRRIILQANALIDSGHNVTIIGSPYKDENFLSGEVNNKIRIKRINPQDIQYDAPMVRWYKRLHQKINGFAIKRNKFLNKYYSKNMKCVDEDTSNKEIKYINNKIIRFNIKAINYLSTKFISLSQHIVNLGYKCGLIFVRLFKINFFPTFDIAFYNAGINEKADIVVANDLPSLKASHSIARKKNIPLIYDAHENYTEQCTLPKKYALKLEQIEAQILPEVDFWIVPNELLGECIIEKCMTKYNVEVAPPLVVQNAVNTWKDYDQCKDADIIREKLNIEKDKKILLFQGGFLAKRNLENLVRSMKYVKNQDVVLVMLGFGKHVEVLKKISDRFMLNDKIKFLDAVPQSELLKYTCCADVGVIPYPSIDKNTHFCSPNKLYEYIQGRLPILANDLPFLRKVVGENNIGKVQDFSNPTLIANAIDYMFSDEIKLQEYKNNIGEIAEIYCWEREVEKLLSRYDELTNNNESQIEDQVV